MTILIFNSHGRTMVFDGWAASANQDGSGGIILESSESEEANQLAMSIDEFLFLISEGGKVVDLRKFQEKT